MAFNAPDQPPALQPRGCDSFAHALRGHVLTCKRPLDEAPGRIASLHLQPRLGEEESSTEGHRAPSEMGPKGTVPLICLH